MRVVGWSGGRVVVSRAPPVTDWRGAGGEGGRWVLQVMGMNVDFLDKEGFR